MLQRVQHMIRLAAQVRLRELHQSVLRIATRIVLIQQADGLIRSAQDCAKECAVDVIRPLLVSSQLWNEQLENVSTTAEGLYVEQNKRES